MSDLPNEIDLLFKNHELVGHFGMSYLDQKLHGILKSDLILIGARSGAGKSTIANQIAYNNAKSGVMVSLFSLENYRNEFELTEIYKECRKLCPYYFDDDIDFREFKSRIKKYPEKIYKNAYANVMENTKNISLIAREPGGFNIGNLQIKFVEHAKAGAQLFIIDHIDYFDMHKPQASENQNISEIMREIRNLQDVYGVPVVLISHLRKGIKETIIPTLEDFMGTSNKVKESTMVILFAPADDDNYDNTSNIKKTYVAIRKERGLGAFNTVCRIGFDLKSKAYEDHFEVLKVNYWGTKVEPIDKTPEEPQIKKPKVKAKIEWSE